MTRTRISFSRPFWPWRHPKNVTAFFDDLCTVPELKAMSQRLAVAHMLSQKQVYSDIVAETGASTATISG